MVPYWVNLEIGVLIRLWDLAESSFTSWGRREGRNSSVALQPPQQPGSPDTQAAAKGGVVWRLMNLSIRDLRLTVMVRSPDMDSVKDNPTARWILKLPTDMPNMDIEIQKIELQDLFGSRDQFKGLIKRKFIRNVKYSALRSVFLSYFATIVKGIVNALWWLFRGPFDALTVAKESGSATRHPWFWWTLPMVFGSAEGTYRAMADLVGNSVFFVVLVLNTIRQVIIRTPRPRAQSLLDGLVYGFRGFLLDAFLVTSFHQLWLQTCIAYQDWGRVWAAIVFCIWLLKVPLGPFLGVLHFIASICEGLAHILLHEEAQFAPFEPQRIVESESWNPYMELPDATDGHFAPMAVSGFGAEVAPRNEVPKKWWLFQTQRVIQAIADDDEVMERMRRPMHFALHS